MNVTAADLLSIEDGIPASPGLPECLGDRYLYQNNLLFRAVRDLFIEHGFQYVTELDPLARVYNGSPLLALEELLGAGCVPYRNNVDVLRFLARRYPAFVLSPAECIGQIKPNYLLHESSHLVARHALSIFPPGDRRDTVVRAIIEESFANTNENLALAFGRNSRLHRFFHAMNTYITFDDFGVRARQSSTLFSMLGSRRTVECVMLAYVYRNLFNGEITAEVVDSWIAPLFGASAVPAIERALLEINFVATFTLSAGFRNNTTPMFFRMLGFAKEYSEIRKRKPDGDTLRELNLINYVRRLAAILIDKAEHQESHDPRPSDHLDVMAGITGGMAVEGVTADRGD